MSRLFAHTSWCFSDLADRCRRIVRSIRHIQKNLSNGKGLKYENGWESAECRGKGACSEERFLCASTSTALERTAGTCNRVYQTCEYLIVNVRTRRRFSGISALPVRHRVGPTPRRKIARLHDQFKTTLSTAASSTYGATAGRRDKSAFSSRAAPVTVWARFGPVDTVSIGTCRYSDTKRR